jgi:hypothetical protein
VKRYIQSSREYLKEGVEDVSRMIEHQYQELRAAQANDRKKMMVFMHGYLFNNIKDDLSTFAMRQILTQYTRLTAAQAEAKKLKKKDIVLPGCTHVVRALAKYHCVDDGESPEEHHLLRLN